MKRLAFLFALAAALCFGQAIEDFAWWDSPIAQNLNLTPDQQNQIRGTVREFRDRLIEQRAGVQKAEAGFMDFLNDDQVNEARAKEAVDRLVAARGDLMRSVSQMSLKLRTVLTPQQWQELQRRRARQAPQGRGTLAPGQQQRLRLRGALAPAQRAQIQQRLRQIDKRLDRAGDLTPDERQQLLDQLRQIEQTLQAGGEAPPPDRGPNPQRGGGPQQPPPGGQPF